MQEWLTAQKIVQTVLERKKKRSNSSMSRSKDRRTRLLNRIDKLETGAGWENPFCTGPFMLIRYAQNNVHAC